MKRALAAMFAVFAAAGFVTAAAAADSDKPQYYELRVYSTKSEQQQKQINDYWQNAAVPAYNRLGVKPIGVFSELEDSPTSKIYVLIPFDSLEAFAGAGAKLAADTAYQQAAADYLNVPKAEPAYERIDSSLLVAFDGMKKLAVPPSTAEKKPWIFEIRNYQSHSESKGDNKVQMFNNGEIAIMKDAGLTPVFFAQKVAGSGMPDLVYMLSGENREVHRQHFQAFARSPGWQTMSRDPQYRDNTSKIMPSVFLKRMPASQI